MNKKIIKAIIKKDIHSLFFSMELWLPILIVPLVFVIFLPFLIFILGKTVNMALSGNNYAIVNKMLASLPNGVIKAEVFSLPTLNQKFVYIFLNYMFVPLFLIIPIMVSSVISANSFVGEKEKKTLETLLFSPAKELELFVAKILAAFIPTMCISLLSFILYGIIIDTLGYSFFNKFIFPSANWLFVILWLIPALSIFDIFLNVYVSAKVKGFQEAQNISGLVVLPLLLLLFGQMFGVLFLSSLVIFIIGAVVFLIDIFLIKAVSKTFNRNELFKSQVL